MHDIRTASSENGNTVLLRFFASLRLTVVCLALGMVLVFLGTLAQVHEGIHAVQARYFHSLLVFWSPPGVAWRIPVLPGGYLLGSLLLANLLTAHFVRFRWSWRKFGIIILHSGIILLLIGQLLAGLLTHETQMRIHEGQTVAYSDAFSETELAVIELSDPGYERVVAIPELTLAKGGIIQRPDLPFSVMIRRFMGNSSLVMRSSQPDAPSPATVGFGLRVVATEIPRTVKDDESNLTSAFIEILGSGGTVGTWLVSNAFPEPQSFILNGRTYQLLLRQRRFYKPFSFTLLDFRHDKYPGTDIPKNFSSRVRLVDPQHNENREVLISMNNPLRYRGYTFFQSGFEDSDRTSVLQVVRNPAAILPYISCSLVALGLVVQFSMQLLKFIGRSAR
jgi:ResB-like family